MGEALPIGQQQLLWATPVPLLTVCRGHLQTFNVRQLELKIKGRPTKTRLPGETYSLAGRCSLDLVFAFGIVMIVYVQFFSHLTGHEYFPCLCNPLKAIYDDYIMFWMCHDLLYISLLVEVEVSGWSLRSIPTVVHYSVSPWWEEVIGIETCQVHLTCPPESL